MDVPLALNHIEIRIRFKGYRRKSSTSNRKTDVEGLSELNIILSPILVTFLILIS